MYSSILTNTDCSCSLCVPFSLDDLNSVRPSERKVHRLLKTLPGDCIVRYDVLAEHIYSFVVSSPDRGLCFLTVRDLGINSDTEVNEYYYHLYDKKDSSLPLRLETIRSKSFVHSKKIQFDLALKQEFRNNFRPDEIPVNHVVVLPFLSKATLKNSCNTNNIDMKRILFKEDLTSSKKFNKKFAQCFPPIKPSLSDSQMKVMEERYMPDLKFLDKQNKPFRLDIYQEQVAKSLHISPVELKGAPNKGKTSTMLYRAKFYAENFPDNKVLILCYDKNHAKHLKEIYDNIQISGGGNTEITYFSAFLCNLAIDKLPFWKYKGKEQIDYLIKNIGVITAQYDAIFIDQGEEFGAGHIEFIRSRLLKKEKKENLFIAVDINNNNTNHFAFPDI